MRILVTCESIAHGTGGGRTGILGLCKALMGSGHDVSLIATNAGMDDHQPQVLNEFSLYEGVNVAFYETQHCIFGNYVSYGFFSELRDNIKLFDLVLIHSIYRFSSTIAAFYARKNNIPYILRPHGTLTPFLVNNRRSFIKKLYINIFEKKSFKNAAAVQFSSKLEMHEAAKYIKEIKKSIIISEGINVDDYVNVPNTGSFETKFPQVKGKFRLLFLGRFHPKKGLDLLLDAFQLIYERFPDMHLVLAGSGDDEYIEQIRNRIDSMSLTEYITITGRISEELKSAVLVESDAFILPSYGENFGLAVVEAMASNLPVIITNRVGISDIILQGDAGIVTSCDVPELVNAVVKLVEDLDFRTQMSGKALKLAKAEFDIEVMGNNMSTIFTDIVKGQH